MPEACETKSQKSHYRAVAQQGRPVEINIILEDVMENAFGV